MTTERVDPASPDPAVIRRAADLLRSGAVVAFPTETVYGLGADATNESAVRRIYEVKGRPAVNPLIVHVPDVAAARALAAHWPEAAEKLAQRWWPGPLTLVVAKSERIPGLVTAGRPTVALRVPAHPVAQAILRAAGVPLAAPSANPSGTTSPTLARHVERGFGDRIPLIVDGGPTDLGIESTVVDLSGTAPRLLRPGAIPELEIERTLGALAGGVSTPAGTGGLPSPGMLERHYAPAARLCLYSRVPDPEVRSRIAEVRRAGGRIGAVTYHATPATCDIAIAMPTEAEGYSRHLYAALHQLDEQGCQLILVEAPPATPEWSAVRDRLRRAGR